jgi:hypothetical protein
MNEKEIAFRAFGGEDGDWYVTVLKFANLRLSERKSSENEYAQYVRSVRKSSDWEKNPKDDEDSNEEIVQMKVKKMIYEPVDYTEKGKKETVKMKMKKIVGDFVDYGQKDEEDKRMKIMEGKADTEKHESGDEEYDSSDEEYDSSDDEYDSSDEEYDSSDDEYDSSDEEDESDDEEDEDHEKCKEKERK